MKENNLIINFIKNKLIIKNGYRIKRKGRRKKERRRT